MRACRLEGWAAKAVLVPILRNAVKRGGTPRDADRSSDEDNEVNLSGGYSKQGGQERFLRQMRELGVDV